MVEPPAKVGFAARAHCPKPQPIVALVILIPSGSIDSFWAPSLQVSRPEEVVAGVLTEALGVAPALLGTARHEANPGDTIKNAAMVAIRICVFMPFLMRSPVGSVSMCCRR